MGVTTKVDSGAKMPGAILPLLCANYMRLTKNSCNLRKVLAQVEVGVVLLLVAQGHCYGFPRNADAL
jgi:hypothetical protein